MKYILLTLALSLTLPAFAMEEYDAQALEKIKALNMQAQGIIIQCIQIAADSSLSNSAQHGLLSKYEGLLPKTYEYLTDTEMFILQQEFEHQRLQEKIQQRKKFWFFNPEAFTVEEYEDIDVLKDAAAMKERVDALLAATE